MTVTRHRTVAEQLHDEISFTNASLRQVELALVVRVGADFAYVLEVKHGRVLPQVEPEPRGAFIRLRSPESDEWTHVTMTAGTGQEDTLIGRVVLAPRATATVVVEVSVSPRPTVVGAGLARVRPPRGGPEPRHDARDGSRAPSRPVRLECADGRLRRLVDRSLHDLASLDQRDPEAPADRYAAAGSPWFLTLFGRDSIWSALMALPFDPGLARGTLRVLARRQGTRDDLVTEEQPGKIVHEIRRGALSDRGDLPDRYFGSVDATPLFVVLAPEAWRWGMPEAEVAALMPHVEAALGWLHDSGDVDGDGFVEYVGTGGSGRLANQGWKDSGDGIRFADGRIATGPIALSEVQAYTYAAALGGADLLEHFGRPGADTWRARAAELRLRFRAAFWVEDALGPYPAIALDADNRPVDGPASNMGHLLAWGLLDATEAAHVARRLVHPSLASGWGLRTLADTSAGYNPLSYHCGSVWPHDTGIAAWGLARAGHGAAAGVLIDGLIQASPWFDYRLPELFSGLAAVDTVVPVPYPAACRPQAWASASTLLMVRALLGAEADVPHGRLTLRPLDVPPCASLAVTGLRVGDGEIDVTLRDGAVSIAMRDTSVEVVLESD